ncbi:MAG: citryl-CoA lyase [Candidatus Magasanikbacteria bacterium]|nr:citryl-CoA lyase [Candidatus Magasanikbacteria bacterium]
MTIKFKTAISNVNAGDEVVRGENLKNLIVAKTFTEVIFLILRGVMPTSEEVQMLNAVLVSMIDHGPGVSSALTARVVQSAGNDLHTGVAAGMLALGGNRHGGALGGAAKFFQENFETQDLPGLLKNLKDKKIRVPGYGHKVLAHDNRTDVLFGVAKETGFFGKYSEFANTVHEEINKIASKKLPLNMDGANAAILSDMGFDWRLITGFFLIGRTPGLVAQVYEEMQSGEGIRRLEESEIEYLGS